MLGNVSLTPKQGKFLNALLEGKTIVLAAQETGVTEQTAHRWLRDPGFSEAYKTYRKDLFDQSLARLHSKFGKAVDTLELHLNEKTTIPRDQIKAAEVVVGKVIETAQMQERITDLEARLEQREQEETYIARFDLSQATPEELDILRRINADIAARKANL